MSSSLLLLSLMEEEVVMTADKFGVKGKCLVLLDSSEKACDQYSSSWSIVRGRDLSAGKGNIVEALLDEDTLTFTRLYRFSQLACFKVEAMAAGPD